MVIGVRETDSNMGSIGAEPVDPRIARLLLEEEVCKYGKLFEPIRAGSDLESGCCKFEKCRSAWLAGVKLALRNCCPMFTVSLSPRSIVCLL